MDFARTWTAFALEAEYDSFGMTRIAAAHNATKAKTTEYRSALIELRIRLHTQGRRPIECFEMSMIDDALSDA